MFESKSTLDSPSSSNSTTFKDTEDLREGIRRLKKDLNAVLLAHYYQDSEIQDLADFVGDSLELSRRAADTEADVIVFAGVHFMAETAKLLNPRKKVLLPDLLAGCSLADSCPASQFESFRRQYPDHVAISYINCSAGVKALSDLICTSSNAEKMIRSVPADKKILFAPDKNLGRYLAKKTGRDMVLWQGACIVHDTFSERKIIRLMMEHPEAKLAAHPECEEAMLDRADFVGSTTGILRYVQSTNFKEYIIATEPGIIHQMERTCTGKTFIPAPPEANCACNECPYMKLNTLEKLHACMENMYPEVELPEEIMDRAAYPIHRMLALS